LLAQKKRLVKQKKRASSVAKNAISIAKKNMQPCLQKKYCKSCCKKNASHIANAGYVADIARYIAKRPNTPTIIHFNPLLTTNNPQYHRHTNVPQL
jgi:hypothetical protein